MGEHLCRRKRCGDRVKASICQPGDSLIILIFGFGFAAEKEKTVDHLACQIETLHLRSPAKYNQSVSSICLTSDKQSDRHQKTIERHDSNRVIEVGVFCDCAKECAKLPDVLGNDGYFL